MLSISSFLTRKKKLSKNSEIYKTIVFYDFGFFVINKKYSRYLKFGYSMYLSTFLLDKIFEIFQLF